LIDLRSLTLERQRRNQGQQQDGGRADLADEL
jgi:hypothetical protein